MNNNIFKEINVDDKKYKICVVKQEDQPLFVSSNNFNFDDDEVIKNTNYSLINLKNFDTIEKINDDYNSSLLNFINEKGNNNLLKQAYQIDYYLIKINEYDKEITQDDLLNKLKIQGLDDLINNDDRNNEIISLLGYLTKVDINKYLQDKTTLKSPFIFQINTFKNLN